MPIPGEFVEGKDILSIRLLRTRIFRGIHGVGVGKLGPDKFQLRVYVTDIKAKGLPQALAKALALPAVPDVSTPFSLIDNLLPAPDRQILKTKTLAVVRAPRASLAAGPWVFNRIDPNCSYATGMNAIPAGLSVWWAKTTAPTAKGPTGTIGYYCRNVPSVLLNPTDPPPPPYLLSCNHVIVPPYVNNAVNNWSPVTIKRHDNKSIAKLHEFVSVKYGPLHSDANPPDWTEPNINSVDAAIALMNTPSLASVRMTSKPSLTIKMADMVEPVDAVGKVSKHGFTSCWTSGDIDDVLCDFVTLEPGNNPREIYFKDQFRVVKLDLPTNTVSRFAGPGDSGSLLYTTEGTGSSQVNTAVGMLIAVGDSLASLNHIDFPGALPGDIDYTLATPIGTVIEKLNDKLRMKSLPEIELITIPRPAGAA
jgi:hypothetical protein